ncbi:MAG: hypothetical protein IK038_08845 [Bacteroidaceae bacterium]|nr:hypothetical protein [Bacteroidaceae bacterium]
MDKYQIISDFIDNNKISKDLQIAVFDAIVEYHPYSIRDVTKVHVKLDNMNYGDIEVYPTERIDIQKLHTGFRVPFCDYQLDDLTLIIKGKANPAKGGKEYTVCITPLRG